jgi:N-acetylglucosamine-6-phosphate deacetylase
MAWTNLSLQEAILGLTANPSKALSLGSGGSIAAGSPADLVLLNGALQVEKTFVRGKLVFERQS